MTAQRVQIDLEFDCKLILWHSHFTFIFYFGSIEKCLSTVLYILKRLVAYFTNSQCQTRTTHTSV